MGTVPMPSAVGRDYRPMQVLFEKAISRSSGRDRRNGRLDPRLRAVAAGRQLRCAEDRESVADAFDLGRGRDSDDEALSPAVRILEVRRRVGDGPGHGDGSLASASHFPESRDQEADFRLSWT